MKVRYEIKVIGLWLLAIVLVLLGCKVWNNATLPLVFVGIVCALASERIIDRYEA